MNPTTEFEPLLQAGKAAVLLGGMHPKTLMRLARIGEVPAIKIGRTWFFRASTLDAWVQSQQHRPCLTEKEM
jgi:excisionase family DNA binding protein